MTTDELRAKFEKHCAKYARNLPLRRHPERDYWYEETRQAWEIWQSAHASRDAEVEALKKRVGNVVRQMKNCASDVTKTPSLTGQWVADTINWFADEIGIDAAIREGE